MRVLLFLFFISFKTHAVMCPSDAPFREISSLLSHGNQLSIPCLPEFWKSREWNETAKNFQLGEAVDATEFLTFQNEIVSSLQGCRPSNAVKPEKMQPKDGLITQLRDHFTNSIVYNWTNEPFIPEEPKEGPKENLFTSFERLNHYLLIAADSEISQEKRKQALGFAKHFYLNLKEDHQYNFIGINDMPLAVGQFFQSQAEAMLEKGCTSPKDVELATFKNLKRASQELLPLGPNADSVGGLASFILSKKNPEWVLQVQAGKSPLDLLFSDPSIKVSGTMEIPSSELKCLGEIILKDW